MIENKNMFLTVGEAAKELGINKNTLLHYDREGVIRSSRDENNYRYYHINQVKNIRAILNLRKVGFSLDKIKTIKNSVLTNDYNFFYEKVTEQIEETKNEINKLEKRIKLLENYKKYIETLKEITETDSEFIFIDKKNYCFLAKSNYIFNIQKIKDKEYAVLYARNQTNDLDSVKLIYEKIKEIEYIPSGDLTIESVAPFSQAEENKEKIKIFKICIKPLTSESLKGLK